MTDLLELAEAKWRELDAHQTGVILGMPHDFYGNDPRINIFDVKVDAGEAPYLTIGIFLGESRWAMQAFTPEQCIGIIGVFLSKPSIQRALKARHIQAGGGE